MSERFSPLTFAANVAVPPPPKSTPPEDETEANEPEQDDGYPAGPRVMDSLQHGSKIQSPKTIKGQTYLRPTRNARRPENKSVLDLSYLAEWTGLEPATPGVTGRYSNQLNYHSGSIPGGC